MKMSDDDCYRALKARDSRFDGAFFVGVSSTGIYCRPICPARTPRFEHCSFLPSAAAAEEAGYRPCLRCRPETAPDSPAWLGSCSRVQRALRMISETATEGLSLESLAPRLGMSSRHLRRLFNAELGATPKSVAQTERFAIARQLLLETQRPIAEIALASGFGSIRRFNAATRQAFGLTPSELRRRAGRENDTRSSAGFKLTLGYRPPYAWADMLDYFRARAVSGLEVVTNDTYKRAVTIGKTPGVIRVACDASRNRLNIEFDLARPAVLSASVQQLRDLFDLTASPADIADHLGTDPLLKEVVRKHPGLRIPGCWSMFETTARAVIGQQVSVRAATTVLGRLVGRYGRRLPAADDDGLSGEPTHIFPEAVDLIGDEFQSIGINRRRAETLARLARLFADDPDFVERSMEPDEARERLLAVKGIGPWTADYVALRALRNPDAFPAADLGLIKAACVDGPKTLARMAEAWRPWRGYAVVYLWKTLN